MTPFDFRHAQFEVADGNLRYFVAERVTVLLMDEVRRRTTQLIQIQLRKTSGAIFAQSPYFPADAGLVGDCRVVADANLGAAIRLGETGVTTSHKVKYSHPLDGHAHFSQDGRVFTRVRRHSIRLDSGEGHLFEFHAFGLGAFDEILPGQERPKRLYLPFAVLDATDAVTVVAEWIPKARLRQVAEERGEIIGPVATLPREAGGKPYLACLLGHPYPSLNKYVLAVNVYPMLSPLVGIDPTLLLLGGWDPDRPAIQHGDSVGFLAFMYPCSNSAEMRARLGSIDYKPPQADDNAG